MINHKQCLIYAFLFLFGSSAYAERLTVTCVLPNANLPPFIMGDSDKIRTENPGLTPEHLQIIFGRFKNLELKIIRLPFARIASCLKSGRADCGISFDQQPGFAAENRFFQLPLSKSDEGDPVKFFSESDLHLYYNKKKAINWNGKTIRPKVKVHSPILHFNRYIERHGIEVVSENFDIERQLQQLRMGRIEALLSLSVLTDPIIERNKLSLIEKSKLPVAAIRNYLVFSNDFYKKNHLVVKEIWNEIPKTKASAEFKRARKKYGLEN